MRCSATVVLPEPAVPRIDDEAGDRPRDQLELRRDRSGRRCRAGACRRAGGALRGRCRGGAAPLGVGVVARAAPRPRRRRGAAARARRARQPSAPAGSRAKMPSGASTRSSAPSRIVHRAARHDRAAARPPGDLLLVLVALLVAVEEARDRRVAPVDDAHAALDAASPCRADVALARRLRARRRCAKYGRARVDLRRLARAAQLAQQRLVLMHPLEVRSRVFCLGPVDERIAQVFELGHDRALGRRRARRARIDHGTHAVEQGLFLRDQRRDGREIRLGGLRSRGCVGRDRAPVKAVERGFRRAPSRCGGPRTGWRCTARGRRMLAMEGPWPTPPPPATGHPSSSSPASWPRRWRCA